MLNVLVIGDDWSSGLTKGVEGFLSAQKDLNVQNGSDLHRSGLLDSTLPSIDLCVCTGAFLGQGRSLEPLLTAEFIEQGRPLALFDTPNGSAFALKASLVLPFRETVDQMKAAADATPESFQRLLKFIEDCRSNKH